MSDTGKDEEGGPGQPISYPEVGNAEATAEWVEDGQKMLSVKPGEVLEIGEDGQLRVKEEEEPARQGRPPMIEIGWKRDEPDWKARWSDKSPAGAAIIAVSQAATRRAACLYAGISVQSFYTWIERGETHTEDEEIAEADRPYVEFLDALTRAEAFNEVDLVIAWRKHIDSDWRAARDLLARRSPEEWGPQEKIEHSGAIDTTGGASGEIARAILDDPDKRKRAYELLGLADDTTPDVHEVVPGIPGAPEAEVSIEVDGNEGVPPAEGAGDEGEAPGIPGDPEGGVSTEVDGPTDMEQAAGDVDGNG